MNTLYIIDTIYNKGASLGILLLATWFSRKMSRFYLILKSYELRNNYKKLDIGFKKSVFKLLENLRFFLEIHYQQAFYA